VKSQLKKIFVKTGTTRLVNIARLKAALTLVNSERVRMAVADLNPAAVRDRLFEILCQLFCDVKRSN